MYKYTYTGGYDVLFCIFIKKLLFNLFVGLYYLTKLAVVTFLLIYTSSATERISVTRHLELVIFLQYSPSYLFSFNNTILTIYVSP